MDAFFPPGPQKHFIAGNVPQFKQNPFRFLTDCPREYGELVHFRFGPAHAYLVNNPRDAHYVLVEAPERFTKHPNYLKTLNSIMGHDLFAPKDEMRKHTRPQTAYDPRWLCDFADQIVGALDLLGWCPGDTPSLPTHLLSMTARMTAQVLFERHEVPAGLRDGVAYSAPLEERRCESPLVPSWANRERWRTRPALTAALTELTTDRRCGMYARLLYTDASTAVDEMLTLYHAGSQTAAHTLSWALSLLAAHPEIDEELAHEIDTVLNGRAPSADDLPALTYTSMVIRETLRLYPPVWIIKRQATREVQIGSYYVPMGSTLFVSPYALHHHPKHFFDPEAFLPQRFAPGYERRLNHHSYMPFGAGARAAMEESFVVTVCTLLLAGMRARWRFEKLTAPHIEACAMTIKPTPFSLRVQPVTSSNVRSAD